MIATAAAAAPSPKRRSRKRPVSGERKTFTQSELRRSIDARFANSLRGWMDERSWGVGDLHDRLKSAGSTVAKPAIHKWLRGDSRPSWEDMQRLGNIFFPENWRMIYPE